MTHGRVGDGHAVVVEANQKVSLVRTASMFLRRVVLDAKHVLFYAFKALK